MLPRDPISRAERKKVTERLLSAAAELEVATYVPPVDPEAPVKVAAFEEAYRAFIRLHHSVSGAPSTRVEKVRLLMCSMLAAETLGDALELLVRFAPLVLRSRGPSGLRHAESHVALLFRHPLRLGVAGLVSEIWPLSLYLGTLECLIDGHLDGVAGQVRIAAPVPDASAARLFEGPLAYGAAELALHVPKHHLGRAVVATRARVLGFTPKLVPSFVSSHQAQLAMAPVVAALLRRALLTDASSAVHLAYIAKRVGVSETTLRRRLAAEGLHFRAIKDTVLNDLAKSWLRDPALSMETIAERLGFSDVPAFRRSFHRVNGCSPMAFRRRSASLV